MVLLVRAADQGHSNMVDAAVMLTAVITAFFVVIGIFLSDLLPFRSNSTANRSPSRNCQDFPTMTSERYVALKLWKG
jgi:hypothetical protein